MDKFGWHRFDEGRIRFSGGVRGIDQGGYDTFEVELPSGRYFGELAHDYPDPQQDAFNLVVPAFGARDSSDIGGLGAAAALAQSDLDRVIHLLPQIADAVSRLPETDRPFVMQGRYLGKVIFQDGWARVADG